MPVQVLDSNDARSRWRDVLDAAHTSGTDIIIQRYGKPMVVVIAYADFLALQETLDDLRTGRRAETAYNAWKNDPDRGKPWEEVEAELVAEGLLDA